MELKHPLVQPWNDGVVCGKGVNDVTPADDVVGKVPAVEGIEVEDLVDDLVIGEFDVNNTVVDDMVVGDVTLVDGIVGDVTLVDGIVGDVTLVDGIVGDVTLVDGIVGDVTLVDGIVGDVTLVDGIVGDVTLVDGIVGVVAVVDVGLAVEDFEVEAVVGDANVEVEVVVDGEVNDVVVDFCVEVVDVFVVVVDVPDVVDCNVVVLT